MFDNVPESVSDLIVLYVSDIALRHVSDIAGSQSDIGVSVGIA